MNSAASFENFGHLFFVFGGGVCLKIGDSSICFVFGIYEPCWVDIMDRLYILACSKTDTAMSWKIVNERDFAREQKIVGCVTYPNGGGEAHSGRKG